MPRTGFDPHAHGFHFANDFVDKVVTIPGYGEVATGGRSGGMAFAALDYWFAGLPVPSHRPEDFPDRAVPDDGTRLADFIHKRLFDSYATWSARQFLTWSLAEDHPTWSSAGVAKMTGEELPRIRRSIDAGRPVALGLVGARSLDELGRNRQVVAYGYDDDGPGLAGGPPIRLFVYDSHHPDTEVVLGLEPGGGQWEASAGGGPWRGLFLQDYARERPPTSTSARPRASGSTPGPRPWAGTSSPSSPPATTATTGPTRRSCGWPCAARPARTLTGSSAATATRPRWSRARSGPCSRPATASARSPAATPSPPATSPSRALARHPPGRAGRGGRGRRHRDPPAAPVAGHGHLHRRHRRGRRRRRRPPGPAPVRRRPGRPLARGGHRRRPGRQAVRARPALRPGPQPQLGPLGDRRRRDGDGSPAGVVGEPYLGLDDWGAGEHSYRSRPAPPSPGRPGPDAGEGPWTIEFAIEVTPLEA